jgi:4,5-DOPA dioxygenase extradiol
MTMPLAPSIFVSHGAPTFALAQSAPARALRAFGVSQPRPDAVVVVSAHWQTPGLRVQAAASPSTVHDFAGFPEALYRLHYPAPGAPTLAAEVRDLLIAAGLPAELDATRGFDHGAWVPLLHLLPEAEVPVLQVSLPQSAGPALAHRLGQALRPLRSRGVWVLASGSLTHNLYELQSMASAPAAYAQEFVEGVERALAHSDIDSLIHYRQRIEGGARAHPSEEHYLPLLVAVGAAAEGERARPVAEGIEFGVLSMAAYAFGGVERAAAA